MYAIAGGKKRDSNNWDRQKGQNSEKRNCEELYFTNLVQSAHIQSVEAIHDSDNHHDKHGGDAKVEETEEGAPGNTPSEFRVVGADDALSEDKVDDEEEDNAGVGEDIGGDSDGGVVGVAGPDDAHDICADAGHAEAEGDGGHDELVAVALVDLEDGHVEGGGGDEEGDEDGRDGSVDVEGWQAAETCAARGVWRALRC